MKASRLGSPLPTSSSGADIVVQAKGMRLEKIQAISNSHQGRTQNDSKVGAELLGVKRV